MTCPCDSCAYKKDNYGPKHCPNFNYFFDAMLQAYDGILKEDPCDSYRPKEDEE